MTTPTLTQAEIRLLEHVRCFRITTPEHAQKLCEFPSAEATTEALKTLRASGLLAVGQLFSDRLCYSLSRAGLDFLQASPTEGKAINPTALLDSYGILAFCAETPNRQKLTRENFLSLYPELAIRGAVQGNYYLDSDEKLPRLGYIAVDRGDNINRIIGRIETKVLRRRAQVPVWQANFLSEGSPLFVLAFVTPSPWKANKFAGYFQKTWPHLPIRTGIVPELFQILNRL